MMDLFRRRGWHAWVIVLTAFPMAFFLNGIRAVLLILNPHSQISAIHNLQGVAILLAGMVLLFLLDGLLERFARPGTGSRERAGAGSDAQGPSNIAAGVVATVMASLVVMSVWAPRWEREPRVALDLSRRMASELGSYLSRELEIDRLFLGSAGFSDSFTRRFSGGDDAVEFFMGVGDRTERHRSALSPKTSIPGSGWIVQEEDMMVLEPDSREVRARVLRKGSQRYFVVDWVEGSRGWGAEVLRSLAAMDRSPLRDPGEIIAMRISVPIEEPIATGRSNAEAETLRFYRKLRPPLEKLKTGVTGVEGKRFSRFSGSGKIFSPVASGA
jgi:exosortase/archaeosortase family protein